MASKAILTTVYTGFNYGSSLQALAGKTIINHCGLACDLVRLKSLVKGRDIRFGKLFTILYRSIVLNNSKALKAYQSSYSKEFVRNTEDLFFKFEEEYLQPMPVSWSQLKKMSNSAVACFSGSDQIWSSSTLYVNPLYYLRFAPAYKRVALSPSFGRDFIADYNKEKMAAWISEYPYLSIREDSGVKLIKELTGKNAQHLLDPTLIINSQEWIQILGVEKKNRNYILAYFLDTPSEYAKKCLNELRQNLKCEIVAIPYEFNDMTYCDKTVAAGPKEFVDLIANASVVCTDSFHGTAFAVNMHTPFFTFEREYGSAHKQSERVLSILRKVNMLDRYQPKDPIKDLYCIDFEESEKVLNLEREKAYNFVNNAITEIRKHEK